MSQGSSLNTGLTVLNLKLFYCPKQRAFCVNKTHIKNKLSSKKLGEIECHLLCHLLPPTCSFALSTKMLANWPQQAVFNHKICSQLEPFWRSNKPNFLAKDSPPWNSYQTNSFIKNVKYKAKCYLIKKLLWSFWEATTAIFKILFHHHMAGIIFLTCITNMECRQIITYHR